MLKHFAPLRQAVKSTMIKENNHGATKQVNNNSQAVGSGGLLMGGFAAI
ncbi:MAG TPA: hypothetical protein VK982_06600 [Bacteroidales bacterium]|nr:hypothetical protein [Bacteroidales bacterium]